MEIEEAALKLEKDNASKLRLKALQSELGDPRSQGTALRGKWDKEKAAIDRVRKVREDLEALRVEMAQAERAYDLNKLAELRHGRLPHLEAELKRLESTPTKTQLLKKKSRLKKWRRLSPSGVASR
ncbi:MAG: hypothetical protein J6386_18830 [Candidatus Synoicihabitans palmerolidicus]|nr:hypothetical protein [Candidatus Synoicihabitans palmerolidicus]